MAILIRTMAPADIAPARALLSQLGYDMNAKEVKRRYEAIKEKHVVFVPGQSLRTPKSGRYLPKNVSGDGWTPAWIAFAELRMPFVVSSVLKRSIATSSIITSAAATPPADHALRIVRAAA